MPSRELQAAIDAAHAAAAIIQPYYRRNIDVAFKADKTPVTEADVRAEQAIREILSARSDLLRRNWYYRSYEAVRYIVTSARQHQRPRTVLSSLFASLRGASLEEAEIDTAPLRCTTLHNPPQPDHYELKPIFSVSPYAQISYEFAFASVARITNGSQMHPLPSY